MKLPILFNIIFSVLGKKICVFFYWLEISGGGVEKTSFFFFLFEGFDHCRTEVRTVKQRIIKNGVHDFGLTPG